MSHPASDMSAQTVRARAAAFVIARREHENWGPQDQAELDSWLAQSPAHTVAYLRIDSAWGRADRLTAIRPPKVNFFLERARPIALRAAAAIAVVTVLGVAATNFIPHPQERVFTTPVGGRETVSFADGTRIELNTDTVLRTRMTSDQRVVWLDKGEAYFQVKHDRMHPFIVFAGDRRVTDLGTQFTMRRDESRLQVAVVQGRVWFDASDKQAASQSALLTPGDVATASAGAMFTKRNSALDVESAISWRRGVLIFRHTSLGEAVAEMNRYNTTKLVVADEGIAQLQIGGTFQANSPELFARAARTMLNLHIENRGNQTLIAR